MKEMRLFLTTLFVLFSASLFAQNITVTGTVTDGRTGEPIPFTSVQVKGTTTGTSTDDLGKFVVSSPSNGVLIFVFIGYQTVEVPVNGRNKVDVAMKEDVLNLEGVVITALGITKSEKTLGYAASKVSSDELTQGRASNVVTGLQGKIAGVKVSSSGATGSSQKVIVRGYSSLNSNNPLYIVDGVPVDNNFSGSAGLNNSIDFGSQSNDINPEEIESVTVLKGASATALYGSRASNGVIIMNTKKGRLNQRTRVTYEASFMGSDVLRVAQTQQWFGQGWMYPFYSNYYGYGYFVGDAATNSYLGGWASNENGSWGPRMDGRTHEWNVQAYYAGLGDKLTKPFSYVKENARNFYDMGFEMSNNITVQGGNEKNSFMVTYGNTYSNGVLPANTDTYKRNTFSVRGHALMLQDKMYLDYSLSFVNKKMRNAMSGQGGNGSTIYNDIYQIPADINIADLKDYNNVYNNASTYFTPYAQNTWWICDNNYGNTVDDRAYGKIELGYNFTKELRLLGRFGGDFTNSSTKIYNEIWKAEYKGVAYPTINYDEASGEIGTYSEQYSRWNQIDASVLMTGDYKIGDNWGVNAVAGWNLNQRQSSYLYGSLEGLEVSDYPSFDNTSGGTPTASSYQWKRRLIGLLAQADINYKEMAYLTLSARNDWSSTLPVGNNSFFYWGSNAALLISDMFPGMKENDVIDFMKLRLAYGQTGNDASVYLTNPFYYLGYSVGSGFGTIQFPLDAVNGGVRSSRLANDKLKPEISTESEIGLDLRLFGSRLNFDLAFYNKDTKNQIISATLAPESGYTSQTNNVGWINNKGVELMVSAIPVRTKDFEWTVNYQFSKNINTVKELWDGLQEYTIYGLTTGPQLKAKVGQSLTTWVMDAVTTVEDKASPYYGYTVVNSRTGYPIMSSSETEVIGKADADFQMGLTNQLKWKNFSLGATLDWSHGGLMYSATQGILNFTGNGENTAYNNRNPFIFPKSVKEVGGEYVENNIPVNLRNKLSYYYNDSYNPYMYRSLLVDKSYLKLREINITYNMPKAWFRNTLISDMSVSLVGRNLLMWTPDQGIIDPEGTNYGNDLTSEYGEYYAAPTTRTFGGSIKINF